MTTMTTISPDELAVSPTKLIGKQWMLITAGTPEHFNCMTASWGGIGFLWGKPVAFVFIRPNRHTYGFVEEQPSFTLSFMPEAYRDDLLFCGRHSGRDTDKMKATKLSPVTLESGLVTYANAELVLECRKMFRTRLQDADFLRWEEVFPKWYNEDNPLHELYICEITAAHRA